MSIVLFCTVPTSLHSLASGMTVFDGSNFSEWYERVHSHWAYWILTWL